MGEPRVLGVLARDIQVTVELDLDFFKKLAKVIEMSEFKYDSTKPEEVEIYDFLNGELYPFIKGTIEGVENGT